MGRIFSLCNGTKFALQLFPKEICSVHIFALKMRRRIGTRCFVLLFVTSVGKFGQKKPLPLLDVMWSSNCLIVMGSQKKRSPSTTRAVLSPGRRIGAPVGIEK